MSHSFSHSSGLLAIAAIVHVGGEIVECAKKLFPTESQRHREGHKENSSRFSVRRCDCVVKSFSSVTIVRVKAGWSQHAFRYTACLVVPELVAQFYRHVVHVNPTTVALTFLLMVLWVAAYWGFRFSVFLAVLATLAFNYYFLPPIGTFTVTDPQNWVALFAFLVTAGIASELADRARRQTADANQRRRDVERLYAFSQRLLATDNVAELLNAIPAYVAMDSAPRLLPCTC